MLVFGTGIGLVAYDFNGTLNKEKVDPQHFKALFYFVGMVLCFWVIFSSYELIQGSQQVSL